MCFWQDHQRAATRHVEGVSVGIRRRSRLRRDQAARTGMIDDQHLLFELTPELIGDDASDYIWAASGRGLRDDLDGFHRIVRACRRRCAIATSTLAAAFQSVSLPMPRNSVVTYSLQLHYALMATGVYLGAIPGSMLHFNAKRPDLAVVPIDVPLRPGPAGIVTLKNRTLNPVAQIFIKLARELSIPLKKMI